MIFINLVKFRKPFSRDVTEKLDAMRSEAEKRGIKFLGIYLTLGRYDAVVVIDAPTIEDAFKASIARQEIMSTETLVGLSREEALKKLLA